MTKASEILLEKLKEDCVSRIPPNEKEESKKTLKPSSIVYNLFRGDYKFSANQFEEIFNELKK